MTNETYQQQQGNVDQAMSDLRDEGFSRRPRNDGWGRRQADPIYEARLASAFQLFTDVMSGRAPSWALKEVLAPSTPAALQIIGSNYPHLGLLHESYTTSDFSNLMGDVLDRMLLARYREHDAVWRQYIKVSRPLRDFRTVRRLALNGAEGQYGTVEEGEGIPYSTTLDEDNYTYTPALYSLGVKLSWRMIMNDDLDAFDSIPDRLGRGGARTQHKFATDLLFDSSGPDATFFASGNGNLLSSNPDLAIDALGTAFATLLAFTDDDSEPIFVQGVHLVVGPGLWVVANNLINQLTVDFPGVAPGVDGDITVRVNNWIVRNLNLVMDPYIPIIATSNGSSSWLLVADPNQGRPAAEVGFLAGFEEPQLYQKAGNTARIGGGVDQMMGDFETMAMHYKGVTAFGGATLEVLSAVGSNGSNS